MSRVIAFTGYANVGKDEAARALVERLNYERIALADPLKELALRLNPIIDLDLGLDPIHLSDEVDKWGWESAKTANPAVRGFLVRLGQGMKDQFNDQYFWVKHAIDRMQPYHNVVITDVRYKAEARYLRTTVPGVRLVRIDRPGVNPANVQEREVDDIPVHAVINNDGTVEELRAQVLAMVDNAPGQMRFEWDVT